MRSMVWGRGGGALATETDAEGDPTVFENVPDNPPPNYTREGVITNVGDVFTVVYNQQFVSSDGTLTVIGAHMYLFGSTAVGEVIKGMVTCGVTPASASSDDIAPVCTTAIVEQVSPTDPTARTPRTERVGAFDAGGISSVENIQATNAEVSVGMPSSQHEYQRFTPGQTGPLVLLATRTAEAEAQNLGVYWSFDVVDVAGNTTHCTGVKLGPPVAADDSYQTSENTELVVPAPGVLGNDSPAPEGDPLSAVVVSEPANGTLQLQADGSFLYLPHPLFVGVDSFTYRAGDGYGSDDAMVTITVAPDQPTGPPPVSTDPVGKQCRDLAKATGRTVLQNKDCNRLL